jgi:hypothetical protein
MDTGSLNLPANRTEATTSLADLHRQMAKGRRLTMAFQTDLADS